MRDCANKKTPHGLCQEAFLLCWRSLFYATFFDVEHVKPDVDGRVGWQISWNVFFEIFLGFIWHFTGAHVAEFVVPVDDFHFVLDFRLGLIPCANFVIGGTGSDIVFEGFVFDTRKGFELGAQ